MFTSCNNSAFNKLLCTFTTIINLKNLGTWTKRTAANSKLVLLDLDHESAGFEG